MNELVRGYAAATFESASETGDLDGVRGDLVGFARALNDSDGLRLVLIDPLVPTPTRREIVVELLEGRAQKQSVALCSFTIRVERPTEVPATVASLVALVEQELDRVAVGAEPVMEPTAGRTVVRERIRGYAERILQELDAVGDVDVVEDELFAVARVVDANPELRSVLADTELPYVGRAGVVSDLFAASCRPATVRLVSYTLRAGHLRDLVGALDWLVELAAEERGRRIAEVRSAVSLGDEERGRVKSALSRLTERDVEVRDVIDPTVIGGVLVSVGDLIIDGTVRLRIERLRDLLAKAS